MLVPVGAVPVSYTHLDVYKRQGLALILLAAEFFTNGVEWLGKKLNLSEGAVGSVLAAVGTALPESIIPIIAILFSPDASSHEIGIGAILGAPFMLATDVYKRQVLPN